MKNLGVVACAMVVQALQAGIELPVRVQAAGDGFTNELVRAGRTWSANGVAVTLGDDDSVRLASPVRGLSWVKLDWSRTWPAGACSLADVWERAYGDLAWNPIADSPRLSPWYFLVSAEGRTDGYGVETQPNALACWTVRPDGFSLRLDVRAGTQSVLLGNRTLMAAKIVTRRSSSGESAFQAGRVFCRAMCPQPRLPREPFYGYNDWYCAYGKNTATNFLLDAAYIAGCAEGLKNRPYVVMDDGWQRHSPPQMKAMLGHFESGMGPWDDAGPHFGMDMKTFCAKIAALGARPGLWYRPFRAWPDVPAKARLVDDDKFFDPSLPDMRRQILMDIGRFRAWGFKLVKIDYLTYDICRLWGRQQGEGLFGAKSATWRDRSRTACEVLKDLYGAMREAAGDDMIIIGCNALNHLAAGLFELQRIGDDTSGREWKRTKEMGVNALGFRGIQDRTFFLADADCIGLASAGAVPWEKNGQWLDLLARSGTALFVSWHRDLATPEFRTALTRAFRTASEWRPTGEPLDWQSSQWPAPWRFVDGDASYAW